MIDKFIVSIVIPNWNGKALLEKHLPFVIKAVGGAEIIVVDDKSTDGSVEMLRSNFPSVTIFEKSKHEGFASTANAGVKQAKGDVVLLLNTDIEPESNFLSPLIEHFKNPKVFAVGCMDKSVEKGRVVLRGRGVGQWKRGFYVHKRGEVDENSTDWVSGGSGAFRKETWVKLGGMDPIFNPFYWEDIDLSYRAVMAGYQLVFEKKSIVTHYHEEGKILTKYSPLFVRIISARNQFQFSWKHASLRSFIEHSVWTPLVLIRSLIVFDFSFIIGYIYALTRMPQILIGRLLR